VCDTLARRDSKQTCLRNVVVCLFYPGVSLFGDAPRKYSEASVHPAGAKRHLPRQLGHERVCSEQRELTEAAAACTPRLEERGWMPLQHTASITLQSREHHRTAAPDTRNYFCYLRATPRTTYRSRQPVSEPGDQRLSAKDPDPRIAQLVIAALITFLAYFMLRAGYS
jgi:hypothetical protein